MRELTRKEIEEGKTFEEIKATYIRLVTEMMERMVNPYNIRMSYCFVWAHDREDRVDREFIYDR